MFTAYAIEGMDVDTVVKAFKADKAPGSEWVEAEEKFKNPNDIRSYLEKRAIFEQPKWVTTLEYTLVAIQVRSQVVVFLEWYK